MPSYMLLGLLHGFPLVGHEKQIETSMLLAQDSAAEAMSMSL